MPNQTTKSIVVGAPVSQVYAIWSNFENFPHFMENIKSVTKTGDKMSHWVMSGPLGVNIEWDAETTRMEENARIAWNSRDNSTITTSGQVTFTDLEGKQTEVTVTLQYEPPAGIAGDVVAKLFSNPEKRLEEDLQNFKHYAESPGNTRTVNE
ncbi:MAG TPA: SRPBCC family protein [Herpetosiphonaceae bacterium]|nr:SRPBCC family protein [Herpetosiphonaceae bacterium]